MSPQSLQARPGRVWQWRGGPAAWDLTFARAWARDRRGQGTASCERDRAEAAGDGVSLMPSRGFKWADILAIIRAISKAGLSALYENVFEPPAREDIHLQERVSEETPLGGNF